MGEDQHDRSQFAYPRGFAGRVVGHFLAIANAWMAEVAGQMLELGPGARVLEIGFGPGVAIHAIARDAPTATIGGVDPSEVMLHQAVQRNRVAISRGQVDLRLGTASSLPWPDASFDRVLSLNNAHLWDPADQAFSECRRVLRPGGRIVMGLHVMWAHTHSGGPLDSVGAAEDFMLRYLTAGGFVGLEASRRRFPMGNASFVVGTRP